MMKIIDSPNRQENIRAIIDKKESIKYYYNEIYSRYKDCLLRCPDKGAVIELGSGVGYARDHIPGLITSDLIRYSGLDLVVDGTILPFADNSIRMICMANVFHHIPDIKAFLYEAQRCLMPGGRIFIVDQHKGYISDLLLRYLHNEPYDPHAPEWKFRTSGPLSGANGALAWIVFVRDKRKFDGLFPNLCVVGYRPHTPIFYWLSGGLRKWNLLPAFAVRMVKKIEGFLMGCSPHFGSFVDVEIVKK